MSTSLISKALITSVVMAAVTVLAPSAAMAREGAQSVGKGMKCYTAAVKQANGSVTYQQVCYKSV